MKVSNVKMKEYNVKSMLSGLIVVITAKNDRQAMRRGSRYFSEPNRAMIPVRIISRVLA